MQPFPLCRPGFDAHGTACTARRNIAPVRCTAPRLEIQAAVHTAPLCSRCSLAPRRAWIPRNQSAAPCPRFGAPRHFMNMLSLSAGAVGSFSNKPLSPKLNLCQKSNDPGSTPGRDCGAPSLTRVHLIACSGVRLHASVIQYVSLPDAARPARRPVRLAAPIPVFRAVALWSLHSPCRARTRVAGERERRT